MGWLTSLMTLLSSEEQSNEKEIIGNYVLSFCVKGESYEVAIFKNGKWVKRLTISRKRPLSLLSLVEASERENNEN